MFLADAECLEPQVIRALNDIWIELSGQSLPF